MLARVITIRGHQQSEAGARNLLLSHKKVNNKFTLLEFHANTPEDVDFTLDELGIKWDYPEEGSRQIEDLKFPSYKTKNQKARQACFASHASLWALAVREMTSVLILEDDAEFVSKFSEEDIAHTPHFGVIGLNDPRGATRKSKIFHQQIEAEGNVKDCRVIPAPWVDHKSIPQGIAGASAYIIRPFAAQAALQKARDVGGMPNDALLNKQWFPWIGVTTKYFTKVTGTPSLLT